MLRREAYVLAVVMVVGPGLPSFRAPAYGSILAARDCRESWRRIAMPFEQGGLLRRPFLVLFSRRERLAECFGWEFRSSRLNPGGFALDSIHSNETLGMVYNLRPPWAGDAGLRLAGACVFARGGCHRSPTRGQEHPHFGQSRFGHAARGGIGAG